VSNIYHAVVWLDHTEAKVFRFDGAAESEVDIHTHTSLERLHHRREGWEAGGNPPDDTEFSKTALKTFIDHHRPELASRVLAAETLDHASPQLLLALGRRYFRNAIPARKPGGAP
jgi:hypothetical protein